MPSNGSAPKPDGRSTSTVEPGGTACAGDASSRATATAAASERDHRALLSRPGPPEVVALPGRREPVVVPRMRTARRCRQSPAPAAQAESFSRPAGADDVGPLRRPRRTGHRLRKRPQNVGTAVRETHAWRRARAETVRPVVSRGGAAAGRRAAGRRRSRTKMLRAVSSSSALRLFASDSKATNRPSEEIDGGKARQGAVRLAGSGLARPTKAVVFVTRSWTKMFSPGWGSPAVSLTSCSNATKRPSARHRGVEGAAADRAAHDPGRARLEVAHEDARARRRRRRGRGSRRPSRRPPGARRRRSRPRTSSRRRHALDAATWSCPCLQVAHEDVDGPVGVGVAEVAGERLERDVAPVGGDRGVERVAVAPGASARLTKVVVCCCRSRTKMSLCVWAADPSPRLPATEWKATKRPSAEIEASSDDASPPAPVDAARPADERGRVRLQIAHEDVGRVVLGVVGGEVLGLRGERDEAPVRGDRRRGGEPVAGLARHAARPADVAWWCPSAGRARRCCARRRCPRR